MTNWSSVKKLATALFLCLAASPLWADKPLELEFNDFTAGVDTQHLPDKIRGLQDQTNFRTDQTLGLTRRDGFDNETVGCSSQVAHLGMWSFTDSSNSEWFIRLDTGGYLSGAENLGRNSTCVDTQISTGALSTLVNTDADVCLGKVWFTNQQDGLMSWDGTTFVFYTSPKAERVACYKNRLVLANVSNEQSSLRLSGELNGADWSNDSRFSTSPLSIRVGGVNDGYKIYDFFPGLGEGIVFKALSMYRLLGNDQRDFRVEQITPEIGTIYPNTIQQRGAQTIFLSNRGIDAYTPPYSFVPIGTPIRNQVLPLARQSSLSDSIITDSVADWTAGVSSPTQHITTYTVVGAIAPNTNEFITTSDAEWSEGTLSALANADLKVINGDLVFTSTVTPGNSNFSFEDASVCCSTSPLNWGVIGTIATGRTNLSRDGGVVKEGSWAIGAFDGGTDREGLAVTGAAVIISVYNHTSGALLQRQSYPVTVRAITYGPTAWPEATHWENFTLDTTANEGTLGRVEIGVSLTGTGANVVSPKASTATATFGITLTTSVSVWATAEDFERATPNIEQMSIMADLVYADDAFVPSEQPPDVTYTAWYRSKTFDTRVSSPSYGPFRAYNVTGGTAVFRIETSSADNNCCWNGAAITTTTPNITNNAARYIRYVSSFIAVDSQAEATTEIRIASTTLSSYVTGYHRLGLDLGDGVSSFGLFTADDDADGDGTITYQLQSNSVDAFVESAWVTTAKNTVPAITPNRYVFVKTIFQTKAATTTPQVNSYTVNWNVGAGNPKPFAQTFREAYYLWFSTDLNNITTNDRMAVYNRNNVFDQFSGSTLAAACVYNNTLLMGDAFPTGYVYSLDESENGSDIDGPQSNRNVNSYFVLRRLDGNAPDADKIFDKLYITVSRGDVTASQILKVEYAIDGSTTFHRAENVEISTGTSLATLKSSIPIDQIRQGHYIDIKVSEHTQNMMPYTINRMSLYGTIKEIE